QTAEYALRAIVFLASHPEAPCTTQQIAQATHIPAGYLSKVMQSLARGKVVSSQRGLHGGFTLAKPATGLTILEVMQAVDPIQRITQCPLGVESGCAELCPLHRRLDEAIAQVERSFRRTTVAELLPRKAKR
ncbi:MAG: Rrf2 family transcriptional regulator, partial [Deinococcus sp.]|nr:Rrf2 family transcriptional regulator [Deinococcus sp.]